MTFVVTVADEVFLSGLPGRVSLPESEIDFINETSTDKYGKRVYYKFSEDAEFTEENSVEKDYIPVFPGETMYLYRKPENGLFGSKVIEWVIPERPEVSADIQPEKVKKTKIVFTYDNSLEYLCDKAEVFPNGVFINLVPGENYVFSIFIPATEDAFASETLTFEITTETIRNNLIAINIFVVDDSDVETEQISYLLDEEYEPEILMDVVVKSTQASVGFTLDENGFMSCVRDMEIKMDPRVRSAIGFITSAFFDDDAELTQKLVDAFKTGEHDIVIDFINALAEL